MQPVDFKTKTSIRLCLNIMASWAYLEFLKSRSVVEKEVYPKFFMHLIKY